MMLKTEKGRRYTLSKKVKGHIMGGRLRKVRRGRERAERWEGHGDSLSAWGRTNLMGTHPKKSKVSFSDKGGERKIKRKRGRI